MDLHEIRKTSIDSCDIYYNYLKENNKGLEKISVYEIRHPKSNIITLRLSKKLFDTETLFFKILTNNTIYNSSQIKILEYDIDNNFLLIKPTDDILTLFVDLQPSDLVVFSDLKFLITRTKEWFVLNGAHICLPKESSILKDNIMDIDYLAKYPPSKNQKDSIENIFSNPFTYIWGAPGTGKTKYVLSYSILHYIKNDKKVAILAPTNNALEQVLFGVLKMADEEGIERGKFLRLGIPSKKFAEKYPEVCEERGIQKKLDDIDIRISQINRVLKYSGRVEILQNSKEKLLTLGQIPVLLESIEVSSKDIDQFKIEYNKTKKELSEKETSAKLAERKMQVLYKAINSNTQKIKKVFFQSSSKEEEFDLLEESLFNLNKKKENLESSLYLISLKRRNSESKNVEAKRSLSIFLEDFKQYFQNINVLPKNLKQLTIESLESIELEITNKLKKVENYLQIDEQLVEEYSKFSFDNLHSLLNELSISREMIEGKSTEERLKSVNVVACTLDGYIGRFSEKKINVDHIFMDEAGYANIIKSLTLFNNTCPITFLGDHKQLPPVCEINNNDINKSNVDVFMWDQSAIFLESMFFKNKDRLIMDYLQNIDFSPVELIQSSLTSTFRFGTNIAEVLDQHVYKNNLSSSSSENETKIYYLHAEKQSHEYKKRISEFEMKKIKQLVTQLPSDHIILTPYNKQKALLGKHLQNHLQNLQILTVHGSQGREWDTVILSVVDTNDKWFVDSTHKTSKGLNLVNTAVSRAKKQLIIICDTSYWFNQENQLITSLIRQGKEFLLN
ncbi:hypothetical protein BH10BAC5_BH10BAC5_14930 [soil metagenome]